MDNESGPLYAQKKLTSASVGVFMGLYMEFGTH